MYKIHEVLIPVKFCVLMLQILLTIVLAFTKTENIAASIPASETTTSLAYTTGYNSIMACLVLFYIMQAAEMTIQFIGTTIFLNKLSVIQIFFHTLTIMLMAWFIWNTWTYDKIWIMWTFGSLFTLSFEIIGIFYIRLHYRRVLKIQ